MNQQQDDLRHFQPPSSFGRGVLDDLVPARPLPSVLFGWLRLQTGWAQVCVGHSPDAVRTAAHSVARTLGLPDAEVAVLSAQRVPT
jgi:hypothetical protein